MIVQSKKGARLAVIAELACIVGRGSKVDRDSKRAEYTDLDVVWETLYAIKRDAQRALRELNMPAGDLAANGGKAGIRRIKSYNTENCIPHAEEVLASLCFALKHCKLAGSCYTVARIRAAISSAKGAVRAAQYRQSRGYK